MYLEIQFFTFFIYVGVGYEKYAECSHSLPNEHSASLPLSYSMKSRVSKIATIGNNSSNLAALFARFLFTSPIFVVYLRI